MTIASSTGASRSPRNTASACACVDVGGGDRRQRHMRGGERRRVVEAVADHQDAAALALQRFDDARSFPPASIRPAIARCRARSATGRTASIAVAGQNVQLEPEPAQRLHHVGRVGPQRLADRECWPRAPPWAKNTDRRLAPAARAPACAIAAKRGAAEPRLDAVDHRAHALPRLLDRAVERRCRHAPSRASADGQRMPARQRQPRRRLQQRPAR